MPAKNLTRISCTAGLLLTELSAITAAQPVELPGDAQNTPAPITTESTREKLPRLASAVSNHPMQVGQPEQLNQMEFPRLASAVSSHPVQIAQPAPSGELESVSNRAQTAQSPAQSLKPEPQSLHSTPSPPHLLTQSPTPSPQPPAPNPQSPTPNPQPPAPQPPIVQSRIGAEFTTGGGVGYSSSFAGLRGFVPLAQQPGRSVTYLEGQLLISTDRGNPGANVVVGHRLYAPGSDRIYGGYVAYDHRNTGNNGFHQIGVGLETLGETWDVRANAYFPVGNTRQLAAESVTNTVTGFSNPVFQDNFLVINRTLQQQIDRRFEAAATGVDLEAGGRIATLGRTGDLRGYGGLYYFDAPGGDGVVGWRARLEARPTETLRVGLALSRDDTFGTNLVLSLGATFPPTRPGREKLETPLLARLGDSVERNANIVIDRQAEQRITTIQDSRPLTNPTTGQPWRFRHVNTGIGTGDGKFETPTGTVAAALAVAQPDDIVYVQPGTNPGIPAFTIPDGVQVLSTGPVQRIDTVELGNLQLPLSGAGVLPSVLGTVTMGNRTTLSGFAISTSTGAGITGSNISQVIVRDNAIANTAAQGMLFTNVQGTLTVTDNTIQQAALEGFALNNTQGQVDLLLTRNQINNNGAAAIDGDGINVQLRTGATGNLTITNNTIANNSSSGGLADGVDVKLFDSSTATLNLADNSITGNQLNGVAIDLESAAQGTFNLARNTISGNQSSGLALLLSDSAQGTFNLDASTLENNQLRGFQAIFSDLTSGTINVTNSRITGNQDDGFYFQASDLAQPRANIINTTISNNARYGIFTLATLKAEPRLVVEASTISGNGFSGVSLNTGDTPLVTAAFRGNSITGNSLGDFEAFTTLPVATICLQPLNNTIGNLFLDDDLGFNGEILVEAGSLPTNTITSSDLTFWSGTTVPAGDCGL